MIAYKYNDKKKKKSPATTSTSFEEDPGARENNPFPSNLLRVEGRGPDGASLLQVYSFNCFTPEFVDMFNDEIENFYRSIRSSRNIQLQQPNSMNRYGLILSQVGLHDLVTSFQRQYLYPILRILYPKHASRLDSHYSFLVRYNPQEDLGLDMHTDDSDVTFNVCLGYPGFRGSGLQFCGTYGQPDHRKFTTSYRHEIGRAVVHLGSRRHGADRIVQGTRTNLILWNYNDEYRQSDEYTMRSHPDVYQREMGPPDAVCVSPTHDRDAWWAYYDYVPSSSSRQQK